jgi:hypothetical protein
VNNILLFIPKKMCINPLVSILVMFLGLYLFVGHADLKWFLELLVALMRRSSGAALLSLPLTTGSKVIALRVIQGGRQ